MKKYILVMLLSLFASLAHSHPGHGLESAYAGFIHPLTGWDHLLVMLAVGVWAAKLGGKARWQLPLTFVIAMGLGAILGFIGLRFEGLETAIAASVLTIGFLVIFNLPIPLSSRFALISLFALFHGLAHGVELNINQTALTIGGMLLSTCILHAVGLILGAQRFRMAKWFTASLAWFMVIFGSYLLLS
jgi:urease accessory protein